MSIDLTREEMEVVRKLRDKQMPYTEAALAVLMLTHGHARPESELINIIDVYPGLDNKQETRQAIHTLQNRQWLVISTSFNRNITKAAPDLQQKIADYIHDPSLLQRLVQSCTHATQTPPVSIQLVGPMTDEHNHGTFLELLSNANREICLPMLVTPPYESTVPILQERARRGVHIRILLASTKVAKHIRGETAGEKAQNAIRAWQEIARGYPQIEIRITHQIDDMCHLATSWTLDRRLLRYDFYDPKRQRSLAGYMIEFDSRTGLELNIISLFQARFDEAWTQAQPVNILGIWWWLRSHWQWGAFVVTALIAIPFGTSVWGGIIASVSATFLFNALVSSSSTIKTILRRWFSS